MSLDPKFKKLIKRINSSNNHEEIAQALKLIRDPGTTRYKSKSAPVEDEPETTGDPDTPEQDDDDRIEEAALKLSTSFERLIREKDQYKKELRALQSYVDNAELDRVHRKVNESIVDFASASEALSFYNKQWFKSLPFSAEGKQQIAESLIQRVRESVGRTHPLWRSLASGDLTALNAVKYEYELESEDEPSLDEIQEIEPDEIQIEQNEPEQRRRDDWDERKEADEPRPGLNRSKPG